MSLPSWLQLGAAALFESPVRAISPKPVPEAIDEVSRSNHMSFATTPVADPVSVGLARYHDDPCVVTTMRSPDVKWAFEKVWIPSMYFYTSPVEYAPLMLGLRFDWAAALR